MTQLSSMGLSFLFDTAYEYQPHFKDYISNYLELIKMDNPYFDESQLGLAKQNLKVEFYRQFFQAIGQVVFDALIFLDKSGLILEISPKAQSLLEFERDQLLGMSAFDTIVPSHLQYEYQEYLLSGVESPGTDLLMTPQKVVLQKSDTSPLKTELRVNKLTLFGTTFLIASFHEDSDVQQEQAVSQMDIFNFAELIPDAMYVVNPRNKRVTEVNQSFTDLLAYSKDELFALTLFDLFDLSKDMVTQWCELQTDLDTLTYEPFSYFTKSGQSVQIEHAVSLFRRDGDLFYAIFIRSPEGEGIQRSASLGQSIDVAHLYLKPVTRMLEHVLHADLSEGIGQEMQTKGLFLLDVLKQTPLLMQQNYKEEPEWFQPLEFESFFKTWNTDLEIHWAESLPDSLKGPEKYLKYTLFYLLSISAEIEAKQKSLKVCVGPSTSKEKPLMVSFGFSFVDVVFSESEQTQWRLVAGFGTDMQNSSELQWGIAVKLAELYKGEVSFVYSEKDQVLNLSFDIPLEGNAPLFEPIKELVENESDSQPGSIEIPVPENEFELPLSFDFDINIDPPAPPVDPPPMTRESALEAALKAAQSAQASQDAENNNKALISQGGTATRAHILLVEDLDEAAYLVKCYLKDSEFQLTHVENGRKAVETFKTASFDLVFMDLQMPEMGGYEATKQIRVWEKEQKRSFTPIIALTSDPLSQSKETEMEFGFSEFHTKPIEKGPFLDIVYRYIMTSEAPPKSEHLSLDELTKTFDDDPETNHAETDEQANPVGDLLSEDLPSMADIDRPEVVTEAPPLSVPVDDEFTVHISSELASLVPSFIKSRKQDVDKLQSAIRDKDFERLGLLGQNISSVSGLYGFETLQDMGDILDEASGEEDMKAIVQTLVKYKNYIDKIDVVIG